MIKLNFGKSNWVCSRKDPSEYSDQIIEVPETGELPSIPGSIKCHNGYRRGEYVVFEIESNSAETAEILIVETQRGSVAILHREWNEMGHTDESYSGPYRVPDECR